MHINDYNNEIRKTILNHMVDSCANHICITFQTAPDTSKSIGYVEMVETAPDVYEAKPRTINIEVMKSNIKYP